MASRTTLLVGSMAYALLVFVGMASLGLVVLPAFAHVVGWFPIETEAEGAFSLVTLKGLPFLVGLSAASALSFEWLSRLSALRRVVVYGITCLAGWLASAAIAAWLLG
jgi:hypothetical protein